MLYKTAFTASEIPPLFIQLDKLEKQEEHGESTICWKEKARWIRFEEQAETVLGRWSKPHVATIPQTALDDLKTLIRDGKIMLDVMLTDSKEIADGMANELLDYFPDLDSARVFAELFCSPHRHHHEKKARKSISGSNLLHASSTLGDFSSRRGSAFPTNYMDDLSEKEQRNAMEAAALRGNRSSKNLLKYQYSFTDAINLEDFSSIGDFKENTKFRKKVHRKAEGASILVMPVDFVDKTKLVFLRLEAATEIPVLFEVKIRTRFIVLILGPTDSHLKLYEIGRAISTCLADDVCRELFYTAQTQEEVCSIIDTFNSSTMIIPPSEWNPKIRIEPPEKYLSKEERTKVPELLDYMHSDEHAHGDHDHADPTLKGSRKPFAGIVADIRRKLPFYVSDFTDCLNLQSIATTLYIYLVCLCSLVAFGGMLGKKTGNDMGTIECIVAGSLCGVLFSLFSGQPLNIISATGPMLILEGLIKDLCVQYKVDYMEFRLWIGIWCLFFILILVAFNLSFLVKYITRFTEDCFATLVAIIFIIDAIKSTFGLRKMPDEAKSASSVVMAGSNGSNSKSLFGSNLTTLAAKTTLNPNNVEYQLKHATQEANFFFSCLLFLITFAICMKLKAFRTKPYLPTKIRVIISDFSVMIAIVLTSFLDYSIGLSTQKLTIPSEFRPTSNRSWLVPLFAKNKLVHILIAIVPAIIATILIFMDQQITAVIINRKEFKLKKSNGYHLDLFIIGISIGLCSWLGLPWFVAATVLALTHINSLKVMSENTAPGERPKFIGVREQRASTFIMSVLLGLSVFLTSVLAFIPMAVLYGVFMFMGVSALGNMQFFQRLLILFMPAKYQPDEPYLRHVSTARVHLFTIIQLFSTSGLYAIKYIESIAITFPILVLATCGVRKLLDFVFTQRELFWLDDILPSKNAAKKKREMMKEEQELIKKKKEERNEKHHETLSGDDEPNYFTAGGNGPTTIKVKSEHQPKSNSSPKSNNHGGGQIRVIRLNSDTRVASKKSSLSSSSDSNNHNVTSNNNNNNSSSHGDHMNMKSLDENKQAESNQQSNNNHNHKHANIPDIYINDTDNNNNNNNNDTSDNKNSNNDNNNKDNSATPKSAHVVFGVKTDE